MVACYITVLGKDTLCPILISVTHITELQVLELKDEGLLVGATVTIAQLEDKLKEVIKTLTGGTIIIILLLQDYTLTVSKVKFFAAILEMLHWYAGPQIRNVAVSYTRMKLSGFQSIGGNIIMGTGSDIVPILIAIGATLTVALKSLWDIS